MRAAFRPTGRTVTSVLFALLSLQLALSTLIVFRWLFGLSPQGRNWVRLMIQCDSAHPVELPSERVADLPSLTDWVSSSSGELGALESCAAPAQYGQLRWLAGGLVLVLAVAALLYAAHPRVLRRRYRMRQLDPSDAALLLAELERLRRVAGAGRVRFLSRPFDPVPSAFVHGLPGRRAVVLSAGLVVRFHTDRAAFRAVVLHELAHVRNRDVDQTYAALALTGAFTLVVSGAAVWLCVTADSYPRHAAGFVLRVAGLLVVTGVLLAALFRAREFQADARLGAWGAEGEALPRILAGMPSPVRRGRPRLHPTPAARLAALRGSAPLFGQDFLGGLGIGLTAMIGQAGLSRAAWLLEPDVSRAVWVHVGMAVLVAAAVVGGRWRLESGLDTRSEAGRVWPFGTGLSTGMALGPLLSLEAAVGRIDVLGLLVWMVVWTPLVIALTAPVTCWVVRGTAAAAQAGYGRRAVLLLVVALATAAYTVVVRLVDMAFLIAAPFAGEGPRAAVSKLVDPVMAAEVAWASDAVPTLLGCVVVLAVVTIGVRVTGRLRTRQRAGAPVARADGWRTALQSGLRAGLVVGAAVLLLVLLTAWQAHRLPLVERWGNEFVVRFQLLLIAIIDVIALLTGLFTAGRSPRTGLLRGGVAALVCAAAGAVALTFQPVVGHCVGAFALRPSGRGCLTAPAWNSAMPALLPGVTGVLCLLLLPPWLSMRHWVADRLPPRGWPGAPQRPRRSRVLVLAAGLPLLAGLFLIGHTTVRESARPPAMAGASVGDQGWVGASGYRFRLALGWFDVSSERDDSGAELRVRPEESLLRAQVTVARLTQLFPFEDSKTKILAKGGQEIAVVGHRALVLDGQVPGEDRNRFVLIENGAQQLLVHLSAQPQDWPDRLEDLDAMLASWQWRTAEGGADGPAPAESGDGVPGHGD